MTDRTDEPTEAFVVFAGARRVGRGTLAEAAIAAARAVRDGDAVLVFDARTGEVRDLDLRGDEADLIARYAPALPAARRGRPKLGVVGREVTLLPRHWDWLATQPGGASIALRKLVEDARKQDGEAGDARRRTEAAYRFMAAIAGNLPGFEEASRALFARDEAQLKRCAKDWPRDVRDQVLSYLNA
jgi:uncharacterized protein